MTPALRYLSRLCCRWGGEFWLLDSVSFNNLSFSSGYTQHPSGHHAICLRDRRVIADRVHVNAGAVVHEMGHVFLAEGNPRDTHEPDWLGWEIVLARRARCWRIWSKQNADYGLKFEARFFEWSTLSAAEQRRASAERIAYAQQIGVVSRAGEPLCTRAA